MLLMFAPLFVISAGIWTALDAARRRQNWFAWGVAVSVTGIALIAWLVVRRRFAPAFLRWSRASFSWSAWTSS